MRSCPGHLMNEATDNGGDVFMASEARDTTFDPSRRFVRFHRINPQGFVEFAFAIGAPELSVELMLRPEDFEAFCQIQRAERLDLVSPCSPDA